MQQHETFSLTLKVNQRPRCPGCGNPLLVPTTVIRFGLAMCSAPECAIECKARRIQAESFDTKCKRYFSDSRGVRFWTPRDVPSDAPYAFNHAFPVDNGPRRSHPHVKVNAGTGEVFEQQSMF